MKRRRMSAECEMDHSYAMPNIVSCFETSSQWAFMFIFIFERFRVIIQMPF